MSLTIDIGGEGRHSGAVNVNPSRVRTLGPHRGLPIPRLIQARADCLPLATGSVDRILVERTPLSSHALREIARVISPGGTIVLRHVPCPDFDRHAAARRMLPGTVRTRRSRVGGQTACESVFTVAIATQGDAVESRPLRRSQTEIG